MVVWRVWVRLDVVGVGLLMKVEELREDEKGGKGGK